MVSTGKTDKGLIRKNNEDTIFIFDKEIGPLNNLYIVADGMGGHSCGEIASKNAIINFLGYIEKASVKRIETALLEGLLYANEKVFQLSNANQLYNGMGTTISLCTIKDDKIYIAHIGDSRIYKVNKNEIKLLTKDHTYVNELVELGQLTSEEAKNHPKRSFITRALGVDAIVVVDYYEEELTKGDKILLCSDGLNGMVEDKEILEIMNKSENINISVGMLIDKALENGGRDNVSVIIVEI